MGGNDLPVPLHLMLFASHVDFSSGFWSSFDSRRNRTQPIHLFTNRKRIPLSDFSKRVKQRHKHPQRYTPRVGRPARLWMRQQRYALYKLPIRTQRCAVVKPRPARRSRRLRVTRFPSSRSFSKYEGNASLARRKVGSETRRWLVIGNASRPARRM